MFTILSFILMVTILHTNASFNKVWVFLGPFPVGKTEIDVDPLTAYQHLLADDGTSCTRFSLLRKQLGCPSKFHSEIAMGGYVSFNDISPQVDEITGVNRLILSFPMRNAQVDFNNLIVGLNKITILEFQGWVTNKFFIRKPGYFDITCSRVHSFFIDQILYAGDIYNDGSSKTTIYLNEGVHYLDIRIRGKGNVEFSCSMSSIKKKTMKDNYLQLSTRTDKWEFPDILGGNFPFLQPAWLQIPVTNIADDWCVDLRPEILSFSSPLPNSPSVVVYDSSRLHSLKDISSFRDPLSSNIYDSNIFQHQMIPPRHSQAYRFQIDLLHSNDSMRKLWYRNVKNLSDEKRHCLSFTFFLTGRRNQSDIFINSNSITIQFECRSYFQSFKFTLLDHDGTVTHAAAILPRQAAKRIIENSSALSTEFRDSSIRYPYSVLLTLSGVGVETRSQADSYKYKESPSEKSYTFGLDQAWVLAPFRGGAHNWEGTGFWSILHSLRYLSFVTSQANCIGMRADVSKFIAAGHSRGGHGALTIATHIPDRVISVITASGYMDRENYGDANILFDVDLQMSYMDPKLIAVHQAMIFEHDNAQFASNLHDIDVFIRAGSGDRTVNPYFQRQIARVLSVEGVNITYSEKEGADHWYWDFQQPEDGGVVFDPSIRRFILSHLNITPSAPSDPIQRCLVSDELSIDSPMNCKIKQKNILTRNRVLLKSFTVTSHNPATFDTKHGVKIEQLISRLKKAVIRFKPSNDNPCSWVITPLNVKRFTIKSTFWSEYSSCPGDSDGEREVNPVTGLLKVAGKDFVIENITEELTLCLSTSSSLSPEHLNIVSRSKSNRLSSPLWNLCDVNADPIRKERRFDNYGPARQVFQSPFIIITGTGGYGTPSRSPSIDARSVDFDSNNLTPDTLLDAAKYISAGHLHGSGTYAPIVIDTDPMLFQNNTYAFDEYNIILVGGPDVNKASKFIMDSVNKRNIENEAFFPPIDFFQDPHTNVTSIYFGACRLSDISDDFSTGLNHHGFMFTFPLLFPETVSDAKDSNEPQHHAVNNANHCSITNNRLGLMIGASSIKGLNDLIGFSFSSNVPLTRAPFSNMYGDYFVTGPEIGGKGLGGVIAAGYWGNYWELDTLSGWFPDECT